MTKKISSNKRKYAPMVLFLANSKDLYIFTQNELFYLSEICQLIEKKLSSGHWVTTF